MTPNGQGSIPQQRRISPQCLPGPLSAVPRAQLVSAVHRKRTCEDLQVAIAGRVWVDQAKSFFVSVGDLGAPESEGPETRRTRVINLTALIGLILNTAFSLLFAFLDWRAVFPIPIVTNALANVGYLATLGLNARGHRNTAMWVMFLSVLVNIGVAGIFFGYEGGAWLYLVVLPALGALFVPLNRRWPAAVIVGGGALVFAAVPLLSGDVPQFVSDPTLLRPIFFVVALTVAFFISGVALYYRKVAERAEERSENLLLNILPSEIAERLKAGESPIADEIAEVTVLFCDIVGSTEMADQLPADQLVSALDRLFIDLDEIAYDCGLEKIKTVGDEYFAVAGLEAMDPDHPYRAARAALMIRDQLRHHTLPGFGAVRMRFGLHVGPVVAGVIGRRKFSYDLWGDTVNIASRMQSTADVNMIQLSEAMQARIKDQYRCRELGTVPIKGKGDMTTFELLASSAKTSIT